MPPKIRELIAELERNGFTNRGGKGSHRNGEAKNQTTAKNREMGMVKSKLKRRLRKKFHLGEFQEFGFDVSVNFKKGNGEIQFDKFWNAFIGEIEKNGLVCGGGGDYNGWQVFVTSERKFASPTSSDKERIRIWLESCFEVENCKVGEFLERV